MSVLAAIAVLAVLIFVHELGHFAAARLQGIYANKFSMGFGPVLLKYQGSQTEYAIRAIPLGGFVGFPDDDPDSEIPLDDPNLMRNRPVLDRAIVISAGVIANLIFAYVLLVGQVSTVGVQDLQPGLVIPKVDPSSAAMSAGIQAGDIILSIDNQPLDGYPTATSLFIDKIQASPNIPLPLVIKRGEETLKVNITAIANEEGKGKNQIGNYPCTNDDRAIENGTISH